MRAQSLKSISARLLFLSQKCWCARIAEILLFRNRTFVLVTNHRVLFTGSHHYSVQGASKDFLGAAKKVFSKPREGPENLGSRRSWRSKIMNAINNDHWVVSRLDFRRFSSHILVFNEFLKTVLGDLWGL